MEGIYHTKGINVKFDIFDIIIRKMTNQQFPEPTVGLFIFNPKSEILLCKTHKWKNMYCVPGGHVEIGETIEQAAKREALEETGLNLKNVSVFSIEECIFSEHFWEKKHFIFIECICRTRSAKVKLNDEAQEYLWVSPEKALRLKNVEHYTRKTIKGYLKKLA